MFLFDRIFTTSQEQVSRTRIGRARELSLLYVPSLMQSHTDCSVISGHIHCIIAVTDLTSLVMRACLRVPFSHSSIPYITILNLRSLAVLLDAPLRSVASLRRSCSHLDLLQQRTSQVALCYGRGKPEGAEHQHRGLQLRASGRSWSQRTEFAGQ